MALLREFVDKMIPKVFKQLEHLLKKNNGGQSYFVHDEVEVSCLLEPQCGISPIVPVGNVLSSPPLQSLLFSTSSAHAS
jgi:hypothetical protein